MSIDGMIRELEEKMDLTKDHTDMLGHRMHVMYRFAHKYIIDNKDKKEVYNDPNQLEFDFGDLDISDKPQLVKYKNFEVLIPAGYDLGFYQKINKE